ncbi:hypothetical protein [Croceitalea dokdonensis]|nr:hypothetical protein [Croceitalea dokdonensis]
MAQDLRELFRKQRQENTHRMKSGHEARFLERLETELPQSKGRAHMKWLGIAASIVVLLGVILFVFLQNQEPQRDIQNEVVEVNTAEKKTISLGDLSPQLKKVEQYYVANINYELSKLEISEENKEMVDAYLKRLDDLDKEYEALNSELNDLGPNDQTIEAAITNLELRLQLLIKLKSKLNQLKSSKNEQESTAVM